MGEQKATVNFREKKVVAEISSRSVYIGKKVFVIFLEYIN
jgi:hypothetical protein